MELHRAYSPQDHVGLLRLGKLEEQIELGIALDINSNK